MECDISDSVCLPETGSPGSCSGFSHSFRNEKGEMEEVDAILNDDDKVWTDVRHMHMKDALDRLIEAFKQYSNEHGGGKG